MAMWQRTFQQTAGFLHLDVRLKLVAKSVHVPSDPVHKLPEDVAMEGPGQELPPGLPPGPGAGQEAQAQPRTEELVVKAF